MIRYHTKERGGLMLTEIKEIFEDYQIEPLTGGWSKDSKYILTKDRQAYTLRVCRGKSLEMQKSEYEIIRKISPSDQIIRPVGYGRISEDSSYIMYSYIQGKDLREVLDEFTPIERYDLGIQAGCILKDIHNVPGRKEPDFAAYYTQKIAGKIRAYKDSGHRIPGLDVHIDFLETSTHMLQGRPTVLQHGDYHLGNMIIRERKIYIIDFNRFDFGDPYQEFDRMTMNSSFSREFARGILHGYFKGVPPLEFWSLLKLYVLTNAVGSISWALEHSPDSLGFVYDMIHATLEDYEDLSSPLPKWYREMLRI